MSSGSMSSKSHILPARFFSGLTQTAQFKAHKFLFFNAEMNWKIRICTCRYPSVYWEKEMNLVWASSSLVFARAGGGDEGVGWCLQIHSAIKVLFGRVLISAPPCNIHSPLNRTWDFIPHPTSEVNHIKSLTGNSSSSTENELVFCTWHGKHKFPVPHAMTRGWLLLPLLCVGLRKYQLHSNSF